MVEKLSEKKRFSIVARKRSFAHAFRGLGIIIKTQHNSWIHISIAIIVILLGIYYSISIFEWMTLVFAIGLVFTAEAFNTAVEIDIDLTSPTYHPYARDTKDVAAAAVLIAVFMSIIIGLLIFIPKVF